MFEALIALITTTLLLLGTPGPATMALALTGATFGVRKAIGFYFGLLSGLAITIIFTMVGLAAIFSTFPVLKLVFQIIGGLYICFLAYKIAFASALNSNKPDLAPGFKDGFILNLFNPKPYAAFLSLFSQFLIPHPDSVISYTMTGISCFLVVTFINSNWLFLGSLLGPIFTNPTKGKMIRIAFSVLMVLSVLYTFFN